jgi:hypothetical protein
MVAKAWRPISLLSTLGKTVESVVAERLSYMVKTFRLLPANHFEARKKRSTEQALMPLQESICKAWRGKKVLSLISFDVKAHIMECTRTDCCKGSQQEGSHRHWSDGLTCSSRTTVRRSSSMGTSLNSSGYRRQDCLKDPRSHRCCSSFSTPT